MDRIRVTWEDVETFCDELVRAIEDDVRGKPDTIIAVSRGGIVPATLIGYRLGMSDIEVIHPLVSRDRADSEVKFLRGFHDEIFNVLVVDDILRTGVTIETVLKFPYFDGIRVACFHVMKDLKTDLRPDYYVAEVEKEVIYPWNA